MKETIEKLTNLRSAIATGTFLHQQAAIDTIKEAEATIARLQDEVERLSLDLGLKQEPFMHNYDFVKVKLTGEQVAAIHDELLRKIQQYQKNVNSNLSLNYKWVK